MIPIGGIPNLPQRSAHREGILRYNHEENIFMRVKDNLTLSQPLLGTRPELQLPAPAPLHLWREPVMTANTGGSYHRDAGAAIVTANPSPEVVVTSIAEALSSYPLVMEKCSRSLVLPGEEEVGSDAGVFIYVPAGRVDEPLILNVIPKAGEAQVSWHSLIVVEPGAKVTLVEQYLA